jgi:hypothetical protein
MTEHRGLDHKGVMRYCIQDWHFCWGEGDGIGEATTCCCCRAPIAVRNPDPWEGRMDRYCLRCAELRCDVAKACG